MFGVTRNGWLKPIFNRKSLSQIEHVNLFEECTFELCSHCDCNLVNFCLGNKTTHIKNMTIFHYEWYDLLNCLLITEEILKSVI